MRFTDVCHQDRAISIVRRALRSGRSHHAYLFDGPDGVGKEMAAMVLAERLLCEAEDWAADADACGVCPSCRMFTSRNHPDFHAIHRKLNRLHPEPSVRRTKGLVLGVDVLRHFLIESAGLKPMRGRARVFLIREAERMNPSAQNALLKTLEEPPGASRLILITTSAARLLPTIRSRCQVVSFNPLPPEFVAERLRGEAGMDLETAHMLARLCDGRLGAALRWHRVGLAATLGEVMECLARNDGRDPEAFGKGLISAAEALARRMIALEENDAAGVDDRPSATSKSRRKSVPADRSAKTVAGKAVPTDDFRAAMKLVLMLLAVVFRDALIVQAGGDDTLTALPAHAPLVQRLATGTDPESYIHAVVEAETMLDRSVNNQLLCECLSAAISGDDAIPRRPAPAASGRPARG